MYKRRGSTPCLISKDNEIEFKLSHTHLDDNWQQTLFPAKSAWGPVMPLPQASTNLKTIIATEKRKQPTKPQSTVILPLQRIQRNYTLLNSLNDLLNPSELLDFNSFGYITKAPNTRDSHYDHITYNDVLEIKALFERTMLSYEMTSIEQVVNPFQLLHYQTRKLLNPLYREKLLFHGTMLQNVDSISTNNFDWRMVVNDKYGRGVSFSTKPFYASYYGTENGHYEYEQNRVMFAVKVLVNYEYALKENEYHRIYIPKPPFDTTTDPQSRVYVKYDDSSFYPAYVIRYRKKIS